MTTSVTNTELSENDKIRKSITVRGLSGLRNIGNTCYMDSALQCLSATNLLTAYFLDKKFVQRLQDNTMQNLATIERKKGKYKEDEDVELEKRDIIKTVKKSVVYGYYRLMKLMWSDNIVVEPYEFKTIIGNHNGLFKGSLQNDSQEFMNCVLDRIHEELKKTVQVNYVDIPKSVVSFRRSVEKFKNRLKNTILPDDEKAILLVTYRKYLDEHMEEYVVNSSLEYWEKHIMNSHSIISDIFTGMTYSATTCKDCKFTSLAFQPYISLSLAIPDSHSSVKLEECLKNYASTVTLTNTPTQENKYKCDNCKGYRDASQNTFLWNSPEILIIHMKRFTNKMIGNHCYTEKNSTMIEYPLKDLDLSNAYSPYNKKNYKYELYGVVKQMGSLNGGHYIACCKNPINDKWYEFDDSHVTGIPTAKVENEVISRSAYMLFYKKQYTTTEIDDSSN